MRYYHRSNCTAEQLYSVCKTVKSHSGCGNVCFSWGLQTLPRYDPSGLCLGPLLLVLVSLMLRSSSSARVSPGSFGRAIGLFAPPMRPEKLQLWQLKWSAGPPGQLWLLILCTSSTAGQLFYKPIARKTEAQVRTTRVRKWQQAERIVNKKGQDSSPVWHYFYLYMYYPYCQGLHELHVGKSKILSSI